MRHDFENRFESNPDITNGQIVFRGTRITLRMILASIADGSTDEDILRDFPALTPAHLRAAVRFASAKAIEDMHLPPLPEWLEASLVEEEPSLPRK
jgi:uncharacterized protein (DUF433 family)